MTIGQAITAFRRKKGMTSIELAGKAGIPVEQLTDIELDSEKISPELLNQIADILDVPASAILFQTLDESMMPEEYRDLFRRAKPIMNELLDSYITEDKPKLN